MFKMENQMVHYRRFNPRSASNALTEELIIAFKEVFATEPWNEWRKCVVCNSAWGIKDQLLLESSNYTHCNEPVMEYWLTDTVRDDLNHEITGDSSCWLAMQDEKVVGFTWGYPIELIELERKLGLSLQSLVCRQDIPKLLAYQDELGVLEEYRDQKIARELFVLRFEDFLKQGLSYGVVRTRVLPMPSITYLWFTQKLGYQELVRYPGNDGRVILGQKLSEVKILL